MTDPWIYRRLADERLMDDVPAGAVGTDPATTMLPATVRYGGAEDWVRPEPEPHALTAGQQDHSDPWAFAGEDADPPGAP